MNAKDENEYQLLHEGIRQLYQKTFELSLNNLAEAVIRNRKHS